MRRMHADWFRFQQKENSLGCVLVCIVLSSDVTDERLAKLEVPKGPGLAWLTEAIFKVVLSSVVWRFSWAVRVSQCLLYLLRYFQVLRLSLTVNKIRPIEVADVVNPLFSRQRTKNHQIRIFGPKVPSKLVAQQASKITLGLVCLSIRSPKVPPFLSQGVG